MFEIYVTWWILAQLFFQRIVFSKVENMQL